MTQLNHLPENYLSIHLSQFRNINGICSLALAIIGSVSFLKNENNKIATTLIQLVGITFFFFSFFLGLKTNNDFSQYLNELSSANDLSPFHQKRIKEWRLWITYFYIYFVLIFLVIILFLFQIDKLKQFLFPQMKTKK